MSRPPASPYEPVRLSEGGASDPALAHLGELAREVPRPPALPAPALERVLHRLTHRRARFGGLGVRRLAVVLAVLAVASVAVGRFALGGRARRPPAVTTSARAMPSVAAETPRISAPRAPEPARSAAVAALAVAAHAPSAAAGAPAPAPESQLNAESKALEPAISALRRDRNATGALALLDRYESAFPHGVLWLEARVLRVDALLSLGRRSDALGMLDALPLERVGRGAELRLVRAELRAGADCPSALADFDRVLSAAPAAGAEERALRGRALCRASLGDAVGARSDAERYLAKYPSGRFAPELRAARF